MTDTFAPNQTIELTASVENAGQQPLTDVAGTWMSDQGEIVLDQSNPDVASVVNAPVGTVNVTFTTSNGVVGTYQCEVADQTPASVTITGSTVAPPETPASA